MKSALSQPALSLSNESKGFTLIELMIVIAVIAVLSTIAAFGFGQAQKAGRDTQRKSIINSTRVALECYYNNSGSYPASVNFNDLIGSLGSNCVNRNPTIPTGGILTSYSLSGGAYTITLTPEAGGAAISWYSP